MAFKSDLDTPCLVLDMDILEQNLGNMQGVVAGAGKNLRPHAKTHKCSELAKLQIEAGAVGICVAKVSEAEALAQAGLKNILITGPVITGNKIKTLLGVLKICPSVMVVTDNSGNIKDLEAAAAAEGLVLDMLIDIDAGLHRTGVAPADAPALAHMILSSPHLRLRGIQAYAGQVQHIRSYDERKTTSQACLRGAADLFSELRTTAPACTIFSASGTGTFDIDIEISELTELQTGSYVCMDAEYGAIGSADDENRFSTFPPALRLLTTVISANHRGFVTVDAGLKSLYRDGGRPYIISPEQAGWEYDWFGDEHGKISSARDTSPKASGSVRQPLPPVGAVLELVTSHCDPTINLFDRYYLTRGDNVVGSWPIDLRGCSR